MGKFDFKVIQTAPVSQGVRGKKTTVTSTATPIPTARLANRKSMVVTNTSATTIYLGGEDVDTTDGFDLAQNDSIVIDIDEKLVLYGITASGTATIKTLEVA